MMWFLHHAPPQMVLPACWHATLNITYKDIKQSIRFNVAFKNILSILV